jgi:hypothetical protein
MRGRRFYGPAVRSAGRRRPGLNGMRNHSEALQTLRAQLASGPQPFIALHDVGPAASVRLLAALASAGGVAVQRLLLGSDERAAPAGSVQHVDLPGDSTLRVYASPDDALLPLQVSIAHTLLAHSRLGVLLITDPSPAVLDRAVSALVDAMRAGAGAWPNRALLLLPAKPVAPAVLAEQAAALAAHPGIDVRITPLAANIDDAWRFITGAWNRLREHAAAPPPAPAPSRAAPGRLDAARLEAWQAWLHQTQPIAGLLHGCVFARDTQQLLASHGSAQAAARLATQGAALAHALGAAGEQLGLDPASPEAVLTLGGHHLLLAALPGRSGLFVHLMLDAGRANLTLARLQLGRLFAVLPPA